MTITLHDIREKAKEVKAEVDKYKSTGQCGNQNCMLCTWAMECFFRGINELPRPVYSPRDIIFTIGGQAIVRNPTKIKFSSYNQAMQIIKDSGNGGRFYVHVNWKDSSGGHEFIAVNINQSIYVIDGQSGSVSNIESKSGKKYFEDINYSNSFFWFARTIKN